MVLKKHLSLVISFFTALVLDTAVLPKWNLFHLVPFVMLAVMLAADHVFSLQDAILIGALGGLLEDILCENMIGLTPALCLLAAVLFRGIIRDRDSKLYLVTPCFAGMALGVELVRALAAWAIGMRFGFVNALLYGMLPRAALTGLWGLLFTAIFRPLLKGQVDAA